MQTNIGAQDVIERFRDQYKISKYGSVKYTKNEMYWIGYIYRYYCFTYEILSVQAYRKIKPKELRDMFLPYHTMDPSQSVERILESKRMILNDSEELDRQYKIFKKKREKKTHGMTRRTCPYHSRHSEKFQVIYKLLLNL